MPANALALLEANLIVLEETTITKSSVPSDTAEAPDPKSIVKAVPPPSAL